ncbi:cupredoxin domain-containing protein [Mycobacterium sp. 21AC1]|uniref:cupredoxin domain-containing protein n=1 Tax=[Mycobacterium] appelbergii TaxID=2939269 RepID=UPI002939493D|nr:cupredoxin domain-containing protein [Mycobacterium sp. 21AC1]MDV3126344.1 cupredoxin domain-containing protein [Mycobacterium sp. 21AC1]
MKRIAQFCAAACLIAAVGTACGGSNTSEAPATATSGPATATESAPASGPASVPAPGTPTLTIQGMGFSPALTVAPGTEITIVNNDEVEHSVTSRTEGQFDVHVDGKQRATLTAPSEPGEYAFYCIYHPAMIGTLTVK